MPDLGTLSAAILHRHEPVADCCDRLLRIEERCREARAACVHGAVEVAVDALDQALDDLAKL